MSVSCGPTSWSRADPLGTHILMPALSPTMTEGKLSRWLKSVGDEVKSGDVIAEIETDKATMEVEAVDEGTLSHILVAEGTDGVPVNTPIAMLDGAEGSVTAAPAAAAPAAPAAASSAAAVPACCGHPGTVPGVLRLGSFGYHC